MSGNQSTLDIWVHPTGRGQIDTPVLHIQQNLHPITNLQENNDSNNASETPAARDTTQVGRTINPNTSRPAINRLQRSSATTTTSHNSNHQSWGDSLDFKLQQDIRIAFRNINSFPMTTGNSKTAEIRED
jgi:hypothetical protein